MILSFSITAKLAKELGVPEPVSSGAKTVTRRATWKPKTAAQYIKSYREGRRIHQAWTAMPYAQGEFISLIRLTCEPYQEQLADMRQKDVVLEGGFWSNPEEFRSFLKLPPEHIVWVVRFELIEDL